METVFPRKKAIRRKGIQSTFNALVRSSSFGGLFLMAVTVFTLIAANVDSLSGILDIWKLKANIAIGNFVLEMTLLHWVNDALMAVFFFVVGLEIKREMVVGELSSFKKAALPIFAAIGGMVLPAIIFYSINAGTESQHGWGIPMATDIAFSLGVISLLGRGVPVSLKIFLTALAIVDDIGAIIVLAIFYPSHALSPQFLMLALGVVAFLFIINRLNIHNTAAYLIPGVLLWYFVYQSGIHATIAGVLLAMFIPSKSPINEVRFYVRSKYYLEKFKAASNGQVNILANSKQLGIIHSLHTQIRQVNPLINKFEHRINPYVTYSIMPIFAFANAGVAFDGLPSITSLSTLSLGIFFGLVVGKPVGIFIATFLAVKLKIADLPEEIKWSQMFGVGIIAGIGFTMSIFINSLAFSNINLINEGKIAIMVTSVIAGIIGLIVLKASLGKTPKKVKYKKIKE
ncbi:MAG: Na+/H+ antiporter NhaA [Bacteroidales bacterium]